MAWVAPSTRATGATITAAIWNQDAVANPKFLARPPSVRLTKSTEQSVANNVWRSLSWNTEAWDTDTMWSSTAATRVDINTAGKYLVTASCEFAGSTAGTVRAIGIATAGSSTATPTAISVNHAPPDLGDDGPTLMVHTILSFTATQFLRVQVKQDTGGALNVNHSTVEIPQVAVLWVSS